MESRYVEVGREFTYGEIEAILVRVFGAASPDAKERLVGRYKKLQRLEMPFGDRPRRGSKGKYTINQLCQLLLAFELYEFGMDPKVIASFIIEIVDAPLIKLHEAGEWVEDEFNRPVFLSFEQLITGNYKYIDCLFDTIVLIFAPQIMSSKWFDQSNISPDLFYYWVGPKARILDTIEYENGLAIVNLSRLANRVIEAVL